MQQIFFLHGTLGNARNEKDLYAKIIEINVLYFNWLQLHVLTNKHDVKKGFVCYVYHNKI